jgi:ribosomal protein L11 methyltransferase
MRWRQLSILTRFPEFAEEILFAHGAQSVSFVDAADEPLLEPAPGRTPLWRQTRTVGLFASPDAVHAATAALRATLPDAAAAVITDAHLRDREWVRVWMRDSRPLKFGQRLWVCPRHQPVRERGTALVRLDPGLAFGTGTHPTTALCLDWLARADLAGKRVLDYGCGSGILAIAALKLGARHAVAVDHDPQALAAARGNATRNGVRRRLTVQAPAQFRRARYDVVLANILARPLIALAPRLSASLKSDGRLVMAGLLARQARSVRAAYRGRVAFGRTARDGDWLRLEARRLPRAGTRHKS